MTHSTPSTITSCSNSWQRSDVSGVGGLEFVELAVQEPKILSSCCASWAQELKLRITFAVAFHGHVPGEVSLDDCALVRELDKISKWAGASANKCQTEL